MTLKWLCVHIGFQHYSGSCNRKNLLHSKEDASILLSPVHQTQLYLEMNTTTQTLIRCITRYWYIRYVRFFMSITHTVHEIQDSSSSNLDALITFPMVNLLLHDTTCQTTPQIDMQQARTILLICQWNSIECSIHHIPNTHTVCLLRNICPHMHSTLTTAT